MQICRSKQMYRHRMENLTPHSPHTVTLQRKKGKKETKLKVTKGWSPPKRCLASQQKSLNIILEQHALNSQENPLFCGSAHKDTSAINLKTDLVIQLLVQAHLLRLQLLSLCL